MRSTTCFCGEIFSGEDLDSLVPVALAHFTEKHPEIGIQRHHVRDYLEAEERLTGDSDRLPEIGGVDVSPVTPEHLDEVLDFFDHDAFVGNPAWAACYCMAHHLGGGRAPEWLERTAAQNRAELITRIETGTTWGLIALVDGRVAAWCNLSPRSTIPEYVGRDTHSDDSVGSMVCFVVAPPYRRHGLAARLVEEGCRYLSERGMDQVEAYPVRKPRDDAAAYHGTVPLFAAAGFSVVDEQKGRVIMHKRLTPT